MASPTAIRLKDWRAIIVRVAGRIGADNVGLLSAGIAFYAFLSIFPAIAAGLMIWGLFTDMTTLGPQLQSIRDFAPDAFGLIADQMVVIATQDDGGLTLGVVVSALLALWGASGAVSALMQAMNMAYHEKEKRGFLRLTGLTLLFTFGGIVFAAISLAAIAAVPPILKALYLGAFLEAVAGAARWLMMIALFAVACALIYRIAPSRTSARWRWIVPGALAAGAVWLVASIAFSAYLENFNAYNATFGSLGAVAALLMWFWLSAYAICMGAELNSQLELFTTQDTTVDGPAKPGQRGAFVADHIENPEQASGPTPQAEDVTIPQDLERMPHSRLP
ncbi:MAG: YihY/virulence factor BrkB family protein [Hyphomonadaceae bacterium]|nr:YihY/virulence factor BrkB family protein [Hyphomonadaceae bacterium]